MDTQVGGFLLVFIVLVLGVFFFIRRNSRASYIDKEWKDEGCDVNGNHIFTRKTNIKPTDDIVKKLEEMKKLTETPVNMYKDKKILSYELKVVNTDVIASLTLENKDCMGVWVESSWKDEGCITGVDKNRSMVRGVNPQKRNIEVAGAYAVSSMTPAEINGKLVTSKKYEVVEGKLTVIANILDDSCSLPMAPVTTTESPATTEPITVTTAPATAESPAITAPATAESPAITTTTSPATTTV